MYRCKEFSIYVDKFCKKKKKLLIWSISFIRYDKNMFIYFMVIYYVIRIFNYMREKGGKRVERKFIML